MSAEDCVGCRHINNCLGDCAGYEKVKPHEQTNEEYLRSCTTEQLAEFLTKIILDDKRFRMTMVGGVNETKMWLKQPHTNEVEK